MIDSTLKNAKILIVDDNQSNIEILEGLLDASGFNFYKSTTDPRQVTNLFKSYNPDLLLLDLMMPHLNGFEVMAELHSQISRYTFFPILVLTADITPETKLRALSGGAKDFLSKPFELREVRLRITNLLETRYLHQQIENQNIILEQKVKERTIELEQANKTLKEANEALSIIDKTKSTFLALISHEIRTPLNGILGFTELLKNKIKLPELLVFINYLDQSTKRLSDFSYQALLITELQAAKYKIILQDISPDDLLNTTCDRIQENIQAKSTTITRQYDNTIQKITGDLKLIQICFDRLLDNAIKYSPYNDEVIVKIFTENKTTICQFIDNGNGVPENIISNPFKFFETGEPHIDQSTGLNLAMIKLIMDSHAGLVEIRNNPTKGATISLTFPNRPN